jgi:predicted transcriptional regulator
MSEVLFILTVIFVAYVVYKTVNEQKETPKSTVPKAKPEAPKVVSEQPMPETVVKNVKPAMIKPAVIKQTTPKATTQDTVKKGLRDPKTGEVATSYSNYRFTKRWIKDALVAEGLLEKVYKNNELDAAIEATIKDAIAKLEAMDKYKA